MLRGGHRRRLGPGIAEWIVLFVGVEGAERRLAPEHEDPVAFDGRRNPTSIRRHGCPRRPRIRRVVVLLVHVQVCRNSADSSPDRVELALHHCRSEVLSRGRHLSSVRPLFGEGIVDLVRRENAGFTRASYRKYPSVDCLNRKSSPLCGHTRCGTPHAGFRVVDPDRACRNPTLQVTAYDEYPSVDERRSCVM